MSHPRVIRLPFSAQTRRRWLHPSTNNLPSRSYHSDCKFCGSRSWKALVSGKHTFAWSWNFKFLGGSCVKAEFQVGLVQQNWEPFHLLRDSHWAFQPVTKANATLFRVKIRQGFHPDLRLETASAGLLPPPVHALSLSSHSPVPGLDSIHVPLSHRTADQP